ncbi:MAG: prolyl oligopeptidase family serine peptidase [Acidimicrobiales bacterium]
MPRPRPDPHRPPRPARRPTERTFHGDRFVDPYAWLLDPDDPEVLPHLRQESAWTEVQTADQADRREEIFGEIKRRTQETDLSVPVRDGAWWYLARTEEARPTRSTAASPTTGRAPRRSTTRRPSRSCSTRTRWPPTASTSGWASSTSARTVGGSPTASTGRATSGTSCASATSRPATRPPMPWPTSPTASPGPPTRRPAGTRWSTTQSARTRCGATSWGRTRPDVRVFHEADERFHVSVGSSRSGDVAVIGAGSAVTSESWLLGARSHGRSRRRGGPGARVEYSIAHRRDELWIVSNHGGADDFALWRAPLDGVRTAPIDAWELVLPHRLGRRLNGVEAFAGHLVAHGREGGATALWLLDPADGELRPFEMDDAVGTLAPGANPSFDATTYRFSYQSLATPPSVIDQEVATGVRTVRKRLAVLDGFDDADYATAREWATADDGTQVPISIVWRPDAVPADGPAPCVLYGYGAYEITMDPWFSIARLSLLDRGVAFAIAHVRGGGELGRQWYEDGKFGAKAHSFSDLVACARHLCATGRTAPEVLATRGGSAGGLLVGAATNLAPEQFRAVVAEVPFVDPLTTMLDPTLPLTVIEREEWGDPLHDPEAYGWLKAYSPCENVRRAEDATYPAVLATAGLNDPRVGFHEPTKWVAQLRDHGHRALLNVELGAGHGGPTGRYDAWRDEAFVLAWILRELGVA